VSAGPRGSSGGGPGGSGTHWVVPVLAVLSMVLVAALLSPTPFAGWLFAVAGGLFPVALIALGAARGSRLDRRVGLALVLLLILLESSTVGILVLSGDRSGAAVGAGALGLPAATLLQLLGLWLLPLPVVALAYAWTFDRCGVRREDLAALRRKAERPESS